MRPNQIPLGVLEPARLRGKSFIAANKHRLANRKA